MPDPDRTVEYYFSLVSLWSYVGSRAFADLVERRSLEVVFKPVDLLAVFSVSGGLPVKQRAKQRQAYRLVEMQRWREVRKIPLVLHPRYYPADPAQGHRMLLAALRAGQDVRGFVHAALQAVWADELDIANPETLAVLADQSGLDGKELLAESADPALQARADELTREAIDRQVFGAPFYVYRGEPFWGQDRLELLEAAIASGRDPIGS